MTLGRRRGTRKDYKDFIRSSREKIRKAKAQLEFNLATTVKINKKWVYKHYQQKEDQGRSLSIIGLGQGGNIITKDEKTGILNIFLTSLFNRESGYPHGSQPPELVDRNGKQNRPPAIQEDVVSHLLCLLDTHRSMGPHGVHPRVMRELAEKPVKLLAIIYDQPSLTREVPGNWKLANVMPIYKKDQKENPGICSLHLGAGEDYGTDDLECDHMACTGQPGDQAQPLWV